MRRIAIMKGVAVVISILAIVVLPVAGRLPVSSAAGETVQVVLTLCDGSKKLNIEPNLTFQAGTGNASYAITVDPSTKYQQMVGFGAAMTDSSAWLIWNRLSATQRNTLMNNLFTRNGSGIGLSLIRIPMGASDFTVNGADYTYDDTCCDLNDFSISHDTAYIIPVLQQARSLNSQLRFIAVPWSAPAWMKSSGSLFGGSLLPQYFQMFANYHVKFIQAYNAQGVPIYAIAPQNEPLHESSSYPTMGISAENARTLVRDYLGPAIANAGLSTKIIIYDHNWDNTSYALTTLNDATARNYVDGTAFHCYAGDVSAQTTVHNAYPSKNVWFTECSGGGWATNWCDNVSWNLRNLAIGNFRNWGNSWLLWNIALDTNSGPQNGGCTNCRGVVTIDQSTGAVTYNEEYYTLGHVSKFVDPGAYRIDSTNYGQGQPENVAFQNPDGSIVLIVHSTAAVTFNVRWNGQYFTYSLPAKGTVTFKWTPSGTAPTATPVPTNTPVPPTATPIPGGFTSAAVALHSGKCMDVADMSQNNGAAIQQWDCTGGANQQFEFRPVPGAANTYTLVATHSGKCVDVVNASTANGAQLQQWDCHGGANQQFKLVSVNGNYHLQAVHSGKCADVTDASTANGARIQQWDCYATNQNQLWQIAGAGSSPTPTPASTPTPVPTNTPVPPTPTPSGGCGTTNVALGRPVRVSSTESSSYPGSNAVDGNTGTRWSSAFSDPQWIRVDLGTSRTICRVRLNWEAAYGKAYQIQISGNGRTWTTIYSTSSGDGGIDDLTGLSGSGRYVRMYGTQRGTSHGYSLWEFEVYTK